MFKLIFYMFVLNCFVKGDLIIGSDFFSGKIKNALLLNSVSDSLCVKDLNKYVSDIQLKKQWALYMADASSKPPSGFFSGSLSAMGSFDQCLSIRESILMEEKSRIILGKYCQVNFPLKNVFFENITLDFEITNLTTYKPPYVPQLILSRPTVSMALCIPSSCTEAELHDILKLIPELKRYEFEVSNCQTKNDEDMHLKTTDYIFIAFMIFIITAMILSTCYELHLKKCNKEPYHIILIAFSVHSNGKKLFSTASDSNQLQCINGVRFLSIIWIIYLHAHYGYFYIPLINSVEALTGMATLRMMPYISGALAVDTFFLLSGILVMHSFLKDTEKGKKFSIIQHYVHRYLRLMPPLAMVIFFYMTAIRFAASGPYWPTIYKTCHDYCANNWWSAFLFLQNFANPIEVCVDQTWYLSADMQLYLTSPLIFYFIVKNPKKTIIGLVIMVLISITFTFLIAFFFELHGLILIGGLKNPYYLHVYYMNTFTRCGPWLVGIILGYFIFNEKKNIKLNKMLKNKKVVATGWIISLGTIFCITFLSILLFLPYNVIVHSLYLSLHRVIWSLAVGWIIYVCIVNKSGVINSILSHPSFQVLSRLSYCMYLTHFIFMLMYFGQNNQPVKWNLLSIIHNFAGNLLLTITMSIFWTLAFESPISVIEKLIFKEGQVLGKAELKKDQELERSTNGSTNGLKKMN